MLVEGISGEEVLYAAGMIGDSFRYIFEGAYRGSFDKDFFRTSAMRSWTGLANHRRGTEFNTRVASEFHTLGWHAEPSVQMRRLGAPQKLGDIDVLAWDNSLKQVYAIECKRLQFAKTVGEIVAQLKRFQGKTDDDLGVHLARLEWLKKNLQRVADFLKIDSPDLRIEALLVTSTTVPMQFITGLPITAQQVIPVSRLAESLKLLNG